MKTYRNLKILKINPDAANKVVAAVQRVGTELSRLRGVVDVRSGLKFVDGLVTDQPVLELSVLPETDLEATRAAASALVKSDGIEVTVVFASPWDLKEFAEKHRGMLTRDNAPLLEGVSETADVADATVEALVPYIPPADFRLKKVEDELTLICHASPDAGFRLLKDFLTKTEERITATMYEFTAQHVLDALEAGLASPRRLHLIMDGQAPENVQMRANLENSLADRCECLWAAVADTPDKTTEGFFPTAYHIKVSVQDGENTWLSSGNWKESNQPDIDPILGPLPPGFNGNAFHRKQNRDWHVVAKGQSLAQQFQSFIEFDIEQATPLQAEGVQEIERLDLELFVPAEDEMGVQENVEFFREKTFQCQNVMPLLTPDNYADFVLPIVQGAKKKLYFQNQSLSASLQSPRYAELFDALKTKVNDPDIDARIIVRGDFSPHDIITALAKAGFDMSRVKLQKGCHTKGILVDGEVTVVGSHNWTGQGTTQNRDASLIIPSAEVTEYYEKLFIHDWEKRTMNQLPADAEMARLAFPGEPTPPGMVRVSWREVMGDVPPDWI
jgi:PLD-like domain